MKFIHLTDTHIRWQYDNDGIDAILGQLKKTAPDLEYMLLHAAIIRKLILLKILKAKRWHLWILIPHPEI